MFSRNQQNYQDLANLFKAIIKFGLKMLCQKRHFFRDHLTYIGLTFILIDDKPSYTAIRENVMQLSN